MSGLFALAGLLTLHFIGDFPLQNDWMALGKSKSWKPLLTHVLVYSACFLPFGLAFASLTFLLHLITDFYTSRLTSSLWFIDLVDISASNFKHKYFANVDSNKRHNFFVAIGLDQLIHVWCLALTYAYLFGGN
jgi:hypothetical protein